jgi:hypothetical protein
VVAATTELSKELRLVATSNRTEIALVGPEGVAFVTISVGRGWTNQPPRGWTGIGFKI